MDGEITEKIAAALDRVAVAMRHELSRLARKEGLSTLQAQILLHLASSHKEQSVRELSRDLDFSPGTVSESLKSLAEKGIISLQPSQKNRRKVIPVLTNRGWSAARRLTAFNRPVVQALKDIPPGMVETAYTVLLQVILHLLRQGKIPLVPMCLSCTFYDPDRSFCNLLQEPLSPGDLRILCPDHEPVSELP